MADPPRLIGTPEAPVPAGGTAEWFTGADGALLRAALFPAKGEVRGSVVLSGGRTEPIEKYFEVIEELRGRGFTVLAHDWRGQGLSHRRFPDRGHAAGYDAFLSDFGRLLNAFEARLPKPWFAVGHSMGGCLTLLVIAVGETRFAGAALSAPMIGLVTGPIPRIVGAALAAALCAVGLSGRPMSGRAGWTSFEDNILTHDRARYERNRAQVEQHPELALGAPTWGWLDFAFTANAVLLRGKGAARIKAPVVVVAAGEDRIIDVAVQRQAAARVPGARFVVVDGAFHEILQETDDIRALFWREFDQMVERVSSPSGRSGSPQG